MSTIRTVKNKTYKQFATFGEWTINMELLASWKVLSNGDLTVYLESNIPIIIRGDANVIAFKAWVARHLVIDGYHDENL